MDGKGTDLSNYDNSWYRPGGSVLKRAMWYCTNAIFFINPILHSNGWKKFLLRLFGASIGSGVVIKPGVNVKYPWHLKVGDNVWIGERVWIDNLTTVTIGNNACLSQGAFILTGNHNYKKTTFDLITEPVTIESGGWIGAKATVCPGATIGTHAVLSVGSVATTDLEPWSIYQGVPAVKVKNREMV